MFRSPRRPQSSSRISLVSCYHRAMSESPTPWTDVNLDPPVRGFLHTPASPNGDALILTHGAGANCESPLLVAVADAFRESGFTVLRCDLPFRQVRPHGPPPPGSADR